MKDEGVWKFVLRKIVRELPIGKREDFRKDVYSWTIKQSDEFHNVCLSVKKNLKSSALNPSNLDIELKGDLIQGLDDFIKKNSL